MSGGQEVLRIKDQLQAQLKALDLDFIRASALADDRLKQVNMLTAKIEGAREDLQLLEQKRVEQLAAADHLRVREVQY